MNNPYDYDIDKVKKGDKSAFRSFFGYFYPKLMALACRFVDSQVAEDLVQDVFASYWEKKHLIVVDDIHSYLFKSLQNACLNHIKHQMVVQDYEERVRIAEARMEAIVKSEEQNDVLAHILKQDFRDLVEKSISKLPSKCAEAFRLYYFDDLSRKISIHHGYSSFEPMQDLVDAYWSIDGKTIPDKISVETHKANYEKIWNFAKGLSTEEYKAFATSPDLMTYDYMKEFKNRDSRLYVTLLFPFKGWHETAAGELYYKWNPDVVNKNGNESWTGFSYRKMVAWNPYNYSLYGSADDYPLCRSSFDICRSTIDDERL